MNELFGWLWIHLGVVSGMLLGLGFLRPEFLGGYDSSRRRLVRLGHISFFGLGALNILFAHASPAVQPDCHAIAAIAFIIAGVSMPLSCAIVAWRQHFFPLFFVPVSASLLATGLTAWEMFT